MDLHFWIPRILGLLFIGGLFSLSIYYDNKTAKKKEAEAFSKLDNILASYKRLQNGPENYNEEDPLPERLRSHVYWPDFRHGGTMLEYDLMEAADEIESLQRKLEQTNAKETRKDPV